MHANRILNIASANPHLQDTFSKELGISKILAQILLNRGIKNTKEAEKFLNVKLDHLLDPYSLPNMHKAVGRIRHAAQNKERVMIFSDYDVDGITGLDTIHYLPHRINDGYGLNRNIVNIARQNKISLLITADCATNDHEEIRELRRHKIDVIVTDHHEPLNSDMPLAHSIVNPKLKESTYKYKDLAGVGVAYKLCQAISGEMLFKDLDLVCLGTIADVVPLIGENRIIAKSGLSRISETERLGLKALIEISGIKNKKITSTFVSYILGPRLNASGRMDTAATALNLLLSQIESEARNLAKIIEAHNRQRQKIESEILQEAEALIDKEINFKEHKIIVLAKEGWHPGVLGIVASKLADKFYRPTIVISKVGQFCKGSGRSIKNFHLFKALSECRGLLKTFGGRSHAAGLVISRDSIEDFKHKINRLAAEKLFLEDLIPRIDIDMELSLSDLNESVVTELEALEPFGTGNPEPLFITRKLRLKGEPQGLGRNTLKFWASDGNITCEVIGYGIGDFKDSLVNADYFDLVYIPRIDNWHGERTLLLEVDDIFFR
jgi:single-stranded-DNA-specific exonuclease